MTSNIRAGMKRNFKLKLFEIKNMKNNLQDEVEKTMESLDGLERLKANPYMFQRVQARIEEEANEKLPILRVNYLVAMIVIIIVNVLSLAYYYKDTKSEMNKPNSESIEMISKEYNINSIYNYIY